MGRVAPAAVCGLLLAACGPTFEPPPKIPVSVRDPDTVVLRVTRSGGEGGLGGPNVVPDFSLYADRRVIARGDSGAVTSTVLDKETFDRLIGAANSAELGRPRTLEEPDQPTISDTTDLRFVFAPDGKPRVTHAEGMEHDGEDRDRLDALYDLLVENGPSSDEPYRAERTALLTETGDPGDDDTGIPWPLDVRPAAPKRGDRPTCRLLGRDDALRLDLLMKHDPSETLWSYGDERYLVGRRPLLPEEKGCQDLERVEPVPTKVPAPTPQPKAYAKEPEPCFGIDPALGAPKRSSASCTWIKGDRSLFASVIVFPDAEAALSAYFDRRLGTVGARVEAAPGLGDDAVGAGTEVLVRDRNALINVAYRGGDPDPIVRKLLQGLR